jgi:hypothetical protein
LEDEVDLRSGFGKDEGLSANAGTDVDKDSALREVLEREAYEDKKVSRVEW